MGGENETTAQYSTLLQIQDRFNDLAGAFRNAQTPLGQHYDKALSGAGQFSAHLQPGAVKFMLSWREVFDVCEDAAGLIAGNTGKTKVDLQAMDVDQNIHLTLKI
jgi:hypothetical protein